MPQPLVNIELVCLMVSSPRANVDLQLSPTPRWPVRISAMSKSKKQKSKSQLPEGYRSIVENRKARHRFQVVETLECGIELRGSEVKTLREGKISLDEAFGRLRNGEVWLVDCDIPQYPQAGGFNHEPKRVRKLLLHKREVKRFAAQAKEKGMTLVPLNLYFNDRGIAKLRLGLCRGKQLHDKRESLKKADMQRGLQRAMRARTSRGRGT